MTKRVTYLDNAATTPVRPEVLEAMLPYLGKEAFGNPSSAHRFGRAARAGVEEAKRAIAEAVGAEPNQVVFTSGGTEADNLAIIGAALAARDRKGAFRVAVSATEHKAGLAAAHAVKHLGGEEIILPVTASGLVESSALAAALEARAALVSVMWVNNEVGTIQPVAELANRCCEAGILFHSDAVQAFGKVPVHIHKLDAKWVMRPDDVVKFWDGDTKPLLGGLTLVKTGGHFDGFQVLRVAGRFAAPVPLAETLLAGWLLAQAKIEAPTGPMTIAPVYEDGHIELAGHALRGRARHIPFARHARHAATPKRPSASPGTPRPRQK